MFAYIFVCDSRKTDQTDNVGKLESFKQYFLPVWANPQNWQTGKKFCLRLL